MKDVRSQKHTKPTTRRKLKAAQHHHTTPKALRSAFREEYNTYFSSDFEYDSYEEEGGYKRRGCGDFKPPEERGRRMERGRRRGPVSPSPPSRTNNLIAARSQFEDNARTKKTPKPTWHTGRSTLKAGNKAARNTLCPDDIQKACGYQINNSGTFLKPKWTKGGPHNEYKPSHNIAPTEVLPVLMPGCVLSDESERVIHPMVWGMIPPWHKGDPKTHGLTTHNCRLEGMLTSKLYSHPFKNGFRCVVVCDGFYEWQTTKGSGHKQPYFIYSPQPEGVEIENADSYSSDWSEEKGWKGPQLLKLAGLFQIFKGIDGEEIYSCTVITMESNDTLSWCHHRTPAILETEDQVSDWLDTENITPEKALRMITPPKLIVWHPVSFIVNNSRNKDAECNKRISLIKPEKKLSASGAFMASWLKKDPSPRKTSPKKDSTPLKETSSIKGTSPLKDDLLKESDSPKTTTSSDTSPDRKRLKK